MIRQLCLIAGLCLSASFAGFAQIPDSANELPRRGWFGVALAPHESGAVVTSVVPESTAAVEGIRVGDVIRAVDDIVPRAPDDVVAAIARHAPGTSAVIDLLREGTAQKRSVVLRSLPKETMPGVVFEYDAVTLGDGSRLRTILSVPERREGKLPAVMLLQGGGCGSVDVPLAPDFAQPGLMRSIGAQGYVTMRVEKSGVGDSQGPPCDAIGYADELAGYRAALAALRRHPSVDPERIFVVGISLGGVIAPIVARDGPLRGIVVFGTLAGPPPVYPGRSPRFFREFAAVDVRAAWAAVESPVLVLHGQFDEVSVEDDHATIAAIVNSRRAGRASHRELAGMDHCWTLHASMDESRGHCGSGKASSAVIDAILEFLRARPAL